MILVRQFTMILTGLWSRREVNQNALNFTEKVGHGLLLHRTLVFELQRMLTLRKSIQRI